MKNTPHPAKPGDICLLITPSDTETQSLYNKQEELIGAFGGIPHQDVHYTIQRFDIPKENLSTFIAELSGFVHHYLPIELFATAIIQYEHGFWQTDLLRWVIQPTQTLVDLLDKIENTLNKHGGKAHYLRKDGWLPTLITAVENPKKHIPDSGIQFDKPKLIFTGTKLVISEIAGYRDFIIHKELSI